MSASLPRLLDGLDALHVLGRRVARADWEERFCPGRSRETSGRAWERLKFALRAAGVAATDADGVLVFTRGARAALEALLPPIGPDEEEAPAPVAVSRPAPRPRPEPPPPVDPRALEAHARATWGAFMWIEEAFVAALEEAAPELWRGRASAAREWYRRLDAEQRATLARAS